MKGKRDIFKNPLTVFKVFPRRLTNGGIFNNRLLLSYCFLEIFVGGQGLDGEGQSHERGSPSPPTRENPDVLDSTDLQRKIYNSGAIDGEDVQKITRTSNMQRLSSVFKPKNFEVPES